MTYHDIINIIIFNKNQIIKITVFTVILIFLILYFVYPLTFKSEVSILPPEKENKLGGLSTLLGSQDFSGLLSGGSNANSQLFVEILKSRSAALYVVNKNNLMDYYNADNEIEAARKLNENLNVEITKEGIIKLSIDTKTSLFPGFAGDIEKTKRISADLSNSFVEALDIINRNKMSSKAKNAREYIEQQLVKTKSVLDSVESQLMGFQQSNKAVSLPEQVSAAIDAAAKLKAEIVSTEVELGYLQPNLREDNKTLISLRNKLQELKEQYNKLELGNKDYLLAFKEVPELGRELASLLREVKIHNEVYLLLQQEYYKEKIQENRDLPTVQILDEALPPLQASGPRVIFSTVLGGIFVFLLISLVFVVNEKKAYLVNNKVKEKNIV